MIDTSNNQVSETSETPHVIRKKLHSFSSEPNVWYTIGIIRVQFDDYHEIFYSVSLFNEINYLASLGIYLLNQLDFIEYFTIITSYPLIIPILYTTHQYPILVIFLYKVIWNHLTIYVCAKFYSSIPYIIYIQFYLVFHDFQAKKCSHSRYNILRQIPSMTSSWVSIEVSIYELHSSIATQQMSFLYIILYVICCLS